MTGTTDDSYREPTMSHEQVEKHFRDRQRAWVRHDAETLARGHAEHGILRTPMFGVVRGREHIGATYRLLFRAFSGQQFRFDPMVIDGHRVALPMMASVIHTTEFLGLAPTGQRAEIEGIFIDELSPDGLIVSEHRIYDFTRALVQLGAWPGGREGPLHV